MARLGQGGQSSLYVRNVSGLQEGRNSHTGNQISPLSFPETPCPSPGISSLVGRPRGGSGPREVGGGQCHLPGRAQVGLSGPRWSPAQHGSCPVRQALPAQPQAAPPTSLCLYLKRKGHPLVISGDKMILFFQERRRKLVEIRRGAQPPTASLSWALRCDCGEGSGRAPLPQTGPPAPRGTGSGERYDPRHHGAGGTGEGAAKEEKRTNTPPLTPLGARWWETASDLGRRAVGTSPARGRGQGFVTEAASPSWAPEPRAGSLNALRLSRLLPFLPPPPPALCGPGLRPGHDAAPVNARTQPPRPSADGATCRPFPCRRTFSVRLRAHAPRPPRPRASPPAPTPASCRGFGARAGGGPPPVCRQPEGPAAVEEERDCAEC